MAWMWPQNAACGRSACVRLTDPLRNPSAYSRGTLCKAVRPDFASTLFGSAPAASALPMALRIVEVCTRVCLEVKSTSKHYSDTTGTTPLACID